MPTIKVRKQANGITRYTAIDAAPEAASNKSAASAVRIASRDT